MEQTQQPLCVLATPEGVSSSAPHDVILKLVCAPQPGPVPVLKRPSGVVDPFFIGGGEEDLLCGNCDHILALHVSREQLPRLIFACPMCGYFSDTE